MILHVALPVIGLIVIAAVLPALIERRVPETIGGMFLNAVLSAVVLTLVSAVYFFLSYLERSTAILDLIGVEPASGVGHFLKLGLAAGLIWGPVMVLVISFAPRRWKENTW